MARDVLVVSEPQIPKSVSVGTSIVEVLQEKTTSQRTVMVLTNTSTANQTISIGIGSDAVSGSGIVLKAGSSYYESIDARFTPTNARISAIADAISGSLAVYERSV